MPKIQHAVGGQWVPPRARWVCEKGRNRKFATPWQWHLRMNWLWHCRWTGTIECPKQAPCDQQQVDGLHRLFQSVIKKQRKIDKCHLASVISVGQSMQTFANVNKRNLDGNRQECPWNINQLLQLKSNSCYLLVSFQFEKVISLTKSLKITAKL